jgi:hypothetical protein
MLAEQMRQGIKIKNLNGPDEDQMIQFEITISNGNALTSLVFYGYSGSFTSFGEKLSEFPKNLEDKVIYELGEEKGKGIKNYAYYLLLNAFCFDSAGQTAIKVITNNNRDIPDFSRTEMFLKAEPISLNRLGQSLKTWNPENDKEFEWFSD